MIAAPLLVESLALQAKRVGRRAPDAEHLVVAGVCGAVADGLRPGDVVVATEVRDDRGQVRPFPGAAILAGALTRAGHRVHLGPLHSADRLVRGARRAELAATGALAVDLETYVLTEGALRAQAVRVVVDTPTSELLHPRTVGNGYAALRTLRRIAPVLRAWDAAQRPRDLVLAAPRSFCAGVERAIATVERALEQTDGPVYVRRQIVHNAHVVADLTGRGAVFVQELAEVPERATVVLSAHGVAPAVRAEAAGRDLATIDATCPLVAKVHVEARRAADRGDTVVLIGHAGHEEVDGAVGEAPGTRVVATVEEVEALEVPDPDRVSYLMQTTLSVDESAAVAAAIRRRFPRARPPAGEDICYATSNRQAAVKALGTDLVLVVGSANSSNSRRLVEVAERAGSTARLVEDAGDVDLAEVAAARSVGLTAGASAPPHLVATLAAELAGLGPTTVREVAVTREDLAFELPKEVRR